jgi:hypothetical protein
MQQLPDLMWEPREGGVEVKVRWPALLRIREGGLGKAD